MTTDNQDSHRDEAAQIQGIGVLKPSDITKPLQVVNRSDEIIAHFTREEMVELLARLPPDKHGMLFQFLWRTGCRISEVLAIRKCDLDFQNAEITIRWLKNRKFLYRKIPMHSTLKMPLWSYTATLTAEERLFPYSRQHADKLAKRYGFDHSHKLRHSFAINFLRQSDRPMALVELKELLGHANIRSTMEYLRVVPSNQKKALEAIRFD